VSATCLVTPLGTSHATVSAEGPAVMSSSSTPRARTSLSSVTSMLAGLALAAATLVGCGRPYEVATPNGFVDLEDRYDDRDGDEYRATTADGVVIGVRAYDNEPYAERTFLVRAIENQLRLGRGYSLESTKEVSAKDGTKGTQMRFGHDEPTGPHLYVLTIFTDEDYVYLHEAAGKKELVEKAEASITWSLSEFRPD
jgi:hypothetical protein